MPTQAIRLTPTTGSGSMSLTLSADENFGREARRTVFTARNASLQKSSNDLIVIQSGANEDIVINDGNIIEADYTGNITMTGYSNYETLTFSSPDSGNTLLDTHFVSAQISTDTLIQNVQTLTSGYSPDGDPGETNRYPITLTFHFSSNDSAGTYSFKVNGKTFSCTKRDNVEPGETEIWFSDGATYQAVGIDLLVKLDADGNIKQDSSVQHPYINTIPDGESWTIS